MVFFPIDRTPPEKVAKSARSFREMSGVAEGRILRKLKPLVLAGSIPATTRGEKINLMHEERTTCY